MNVKNRLAIIIIALTVIAIIVSNTVYSRLYVNNLKIQENALINSAQTGIGVYLEEKAKKYQGNVDDYSHWDDAYAYVNNQKPGFIEENFQEYTFQHLEMSFVIIGGQDDAIKYHQYYDFSKETFIPFPSYINMQELIAISTDDNMPHIMQFGNQYYFVVASHVTNSNMDIISNDRMIAGRVIDHAIIEDLENIANGTISISAIKNTAASENTSSTANVNDLLEMVKIYKEKKPIEGTMIVPDTSYNGSSVMVSFLITRDAFINQMSHVLLFIAIRTFGYILFIFVLIHLLGRYISQPFKMIIQDVTKLDLSKREIEKLNARDNDEFAQLRQSINAMLVRIETEQYSVRENKDKLLKTVNILDSILNSIQEGFVELDHDWRFTYVNKRVADYIGIAVEDLIGKHYWDFFPLLEDSHCSDIYRQVMASRNPNSYQAKAKNNERWYDIRIYPSTAGISVFCKDITDKKQAEVALRKSDAQSRALALELAEADIRKNNFLAMLSHEIRNPLASIMLSISLLDRSTSDTIQSRQAREAITRQIGQLSHLIDDLLDITRITQNKIRLHKEPLDLNTLVNKVIQDFAPEFIQKGVRLEFESTDHPLYVEADETRLVQIFGNLVKNAVKYTSGGGYTKVILSQEDTQDVSHAVIRIIDDGIGIDKSMLANLFEPFVQADNSLDRSQGGLGLGLSIVKSFIELHDGNITVHSRGLGKGTEFTVKFPLLTDYKSIQEKKQQHCVKTQRNLRVLVIDDMPDIADILCSLLQELGHKVSTASSGLEGLTKAKEFRPDVIICDIGLPEMNGYDVARNIREDDQMKGIYLIALSGYATLDDQEKAKEAGFNCHLAKPVDLSRLELELNYV